MMVTGLIKNAVDRGAEYLDRVMPGWATRIDVGRLDLSDGQTCILGQLYGEGGYSRGAHQLFLLHGLTVRDCGFELPLGAWRPLPVARLYQPLQDAWIAAIAERVVAADEQARVAQVWSDALANV
jgi:hypothetical protein